MDAPAAQGETYDVCGIPVTAASLRAATAAIVSAAIRHERLEVHLCNAYTMSLVHGDATLRSALARGDLNLPDGAPVAWMGRRHGTRGPVRGATLMRAVCAEGVPHGVRHYLYGGQPGVAQQTAAELARIAPGIRVVGAETPPFVDLDETGLGELAKRIGETGADVVWVGLGTPRQDYLVPRLASRLPVVVVPVGAAFNFLAGYVHESPRPLQGSGLEWLHRLLLEPRRLWRRYLVGNPRFLWHVVRSRGGRSH